MQATNVRAATKNDLSDLVQLWHQKRIIQQQLDPRFSLTADDHKQWAEAAAEWLVDKNCEIVVAERNAALLGYAIGWATPLLPGLLPQQLGYVVDMAVDVHRVQGGLGKLLLSAMRSRFADRGIQQIVACVPHQNAVEQAFWRALGAAEWIDLMWIK